MFEMLPQTQTDIYYSKLASGSLKTQVTSFGDD